MADDARHTPLDLTDLGGDMDVFHLLACLETGQKRFGRAGGPGREPARLGQSPRLGFATSDLAKVTPANDTRAEPHVAINVLGLLGPEGPMPLHITRWMMERLSNRWFAGDDATALADTSFLDLVNLLQHRMMALYWRAWGDARPAIHAKRDTDNRVAVMLRALAGLGLPGAASGDPQRDDPKLRHATSLVQERHGPERLCAYLESVVDAPVSLTEYKGHWRDLPVHLQTRLGRAHSGLGTGAVVGASNFDRLSRVELCVGPVDIETFMAFLSDRGLWQRLCHAALYAAGKEIDIDLRLVLRAQDVPQAQLGKSQLGRTTWLCPKDGQDVDDLCLTTITRSMADEQAAA